MGFDYMSWVDRNWPLLRRLVDGHATIYRATGGLLGHRVPGLAPMLLLDHVGAKSAIRRTTPLLYAKDGDDLIIIASKGGHPRQPAWFHNIMANPDTVVQVGRERRPVHARVAAPSERERLWQIAVQAYPTYNSYQRRTDRQIPVVLLERR